MTTPEAKFLATHLRHVGHLREALLRLRHELELRAERHDLSKLTAAEMPGYVRIEAAADKHRFGTPGYEDAIRREQPALDAHFAANSHHPEYHGRAADMGWLDVVEMVADWWAACRTYGTTSWEETLAVQRRRFCFPAEQWWLIEQVAGWLDGAAPTGARPPRRWPSSPTVSRSPVIPSSSVATPGSRFCIAPLSRDVKQYGYDAGPYASESEALAFPGVAEGDAVWLVGGFSPVALWRHDGSEWVKLPGREEVELRS